MIGLRPNQWPNLSSRPPLTSLFLWSTNWGWNLWSELQNALSTRAHSRPTRHTSAFSSFAMVSRKKPPTSAPREMLRAAMTAVKEGISVVITCSSCSVSPHSQPTTTLSANKNTELCDYLDTERALKTKKTGKQATIHTDGEGTPGYVHQLPQGTSAPSIVANTGKVAPQPRPHRCVQPTRLRLPIRLQHIFLILRMSAILRPSLSLTCLSWTQTALVACQSAWFASVVLCPLYASLKRAVTGSRVSSDRRFMMPFTTR